MKAVILAAGQGTRLRPYTDEVPKCMVPFQGKPIIDYILDGFEQVGIDDIAVVSGYRSNVLQDYLGDRVQWFSNPQYAATNMTSTLFCAKDFMDDDLIVSYSDIVYRPEILKSLQDFQGDVGVVVDKDWEKLWRARMEEPLADAESLRIGSAGNITELGKKVEILEEVQGQYIGLFKISKAVVNEVLGFYQSMNKDRDYDGQNFDNMYMTSFIQNLIDHLLKVYPVWIDGGWVEIDSVDDLQNLQHYRWNNPL